MTSLVAAFSTSIECVRELPVESDYYSNLVKEELQERETDLYTRKWFDYRFMTPLQATALYIEEFGKAYQRLYASEFDRERAEHIRLATLDTVLDTIRNGKRKWRDPLDVKRLESSKRAAKIDFNGFWNGRQVADFLCMPYGLYVSMALECRMRRWKSGYMPRPSHLYHEYDVEKIADRWAKMQVEEVFLADHSAYLVQNYQEIRSQNDYHEWLFTTAFARGVPFEFLARFVQDDRLPIDKVRARLDDDGYRFFERELQHLQ